MRYRRNYGGILQCVALQNTLRNMGHEVEVIQFEPILKTSFLYKALGFLSSNGSFLCLFTALKEQLYRIVKPFIQKTKVPIESLVNRNKSFIASNINYTQLVNEYSIAQLANDFDAIVVGSDKVWTGLAKKKFTYFLDWEPSFRGLRISYAPCSSNYRVPFFKKKMLRSLLAQFDSVSVRDANTQSIIKDINGMEPTIVVDPTLLFDFSSYIEKRIIDEPYIFVYILGDGIKGGYKKALDRIKEVYGQMKVVAVVIADESLEALKFADEIIYDATPIEWMNFIYYAKFVYTDSFHGCLFSMKFKKNFLGYYKSIHRSSRLIDLKKRFQLNCNIVGCVDEFLGYGEKALFINYEELASVLDVHVSQSRRFLVEALQLDHSK